MNFRIRAGTYNATDMTSTYNVEDWPVQDDQRNYRWWVASPSEMARQYDALVDDTLDGSVGAIGDWNLAWRFAVMTPQMLAYARSTIFPTDGFNEVVTIVTYTVTDGWVCLNCNAHYTQPADVGQSKIRGLALLDWMVTFTDGTLNTGGGYDALAYSSGYDTGGIPT